MTENLPEHLREDVNLPQEEIAGGPGSSEEHVTPGQLNAGQQVPGQSLAGESAEGRQEVPEDRG